MAADPLLLETDLDAWAGERVARSGRETALLGRVVSVRLAGDGKILEARVRDQGATPHRVEVAAHGGMLAARCTCPFEIGPICKHAVAAIEAIRFPRPSLAVLGRDARRPRRGGRTARGRGRIVTPAPVPTGTVLTASVEWAPTREERIARARADEVEARKRRAAREKASVRRVRGAHGPPRFRVAGREPDAPYTVTLRGRKGEFPSCTCQDFAKNELGLCKHVERVKRWFSRRPKRFPKRLLSLWWRPREWEETEPDPIREIRIDAVGVPLPESLSSYFETAGWLRPKPDGVAASAWIREAVAAARLASEGTGVGLEFDAAVESLTRRQERAEDLTKQLTSTGPGSETWESVVPTLGLRLHPYQESGVEFLAARGRAFLADDMGLGKTVQAVAAALLLRRALGAAKALVVCPASLKRQWREEIRKACGECAFVVEGGRSDRHRAYRRWRDGFLVLNYELALRDNDAVRRTKADLVILDEAQRIKNWDTKTAKAVKRLESPFAFVLTGTPLENRLVELHSLLEFLHPRALGPRWRLIPYHAVTDPAGRVVAYEALDRLRSRLKGYFLRRERRSVLDQLPPRVDQTFWTDLVPAQWKPYRRQAARVAALLGRNRPLRPAELRVLLQALTTMRILCNAGAQHAWERYGHRIVSTPPSSAAETRLLQSPKLEEFERVLEDLLEQSDVKVVVFSQWERMIRLARWTVGGLLDRRGEHAGLFHGGLDASSRSRVLADFRDDPDCRVLFSTDAGGLGLNLQDSASVVINLEVPWNPAILEQRIGRVHRMGQVRSVQVLHFVSRGTIEERIRRVVEAKRALFEGLLVDEADRVTFDDQGQATFLERVRSLVAVDEDEP